MTSLEVYNNPKKFWLDTSSFLKKEEAKNCLILGLSYHFRFNPDDCLFQCALFENEELIGALVVSSYNTSHRLVTSPVKDKKTAEVLFNRFLESGISIDGLIGEKQTAQIYRKLAEGEGYKLKAHMRQGIYRCSEVKTPRLPDNISFRRAELTDLNIIGEWIKEFHKEAVPHDPATTGKKAAKQKIEKQMVYILEKGGHPVSMAAWSRDVQSSCSVNLVYTPQALRKNGYASMATAKLTQHLLGLGKKETNLFTDLDNPTSNKIYIGIGYEFVCNSVHFGVTK